jgi:pectinesterase
VFAAAKDLKAYLGQYIEGARERGTHPVLVTPPASPSVHCAGSDSAEPQARAIRELGRTRAVPVVDLNADSAGYLAKIGPSPHAEDFFVAEPEGSTELHFRENGARILAGFVAGPLGKIAPALLRSGT